MKGDLIEIHKTLRRLDKLETRDDVFSCRGETRNRGHSLRITGLPFQIERRRIYLVQS